MLRHGPSSFIYTIAVITHWSKLWKHTLVQGQTDSIVLLNGCIEQTLHDTVVAHTLDDVTL